MAHWQESVAEVGLDGRLIELAVGEHRSGRLPRLERLWMYFRNPAEPVGLAGASRGRMRLGQEIGLPERLVGRSGLAVGVDGAGGYAGSAMDHIPGSARREVVIENDIAWRVQTMVDFMFGQPVQVVSTAEDEAQRRVIEKVLDAVWEASGGIGLLQDIALLGHVYGYADLRVRVDAGALRRVGRIEVGADEDGGGGDGGGLVDGLGRETLMAIGRAVRIEPVEPRRGVPLVSASDYRELDGYVIAFEREENEVAPVEKAVDPRRARLFGRKNGVSPNGAHSGSSKRPKRRRVSVTEVIGRDGWRLVEDGEVVGGGDHGVFGGRVPVVHVQNLSQPFEYEGLSEVEALIPLQDELNTRLSDRASRVTMQSFKMYLAKGLEGFDGVPVGPGQVWSTDNPDASVTSFGGDSDSPSEARHVEEIREALDKASAVPPLAGGVVRAKIGNLSSANALRITLMSLLSKTARKRVTYGRGIAEVCGLVLAALDATGVLRTSGVDRGVRLSWPDVLTTDDGERVDVARKKVDLGVPEERVLSELGYAPSDPGVV